MTDFIINASLVPLSEVLSSILEEIVTTVNAAKDVLFEKQNFEKVSSFLERIVPVLKELIRRNTEKYDGLTAAIEILAREVRVARQLTLDCCKKSRVYLLLNCKNIVRKLQGITREIGRALSLIPLASLGISSSIKEEVDKLCVSMLDVEFKVALAGEKVLEQIESGIQVGNADRTYANKLLKDIADKLGVSTESSELRKVIDDLKKEVEEAWLNKDLAEAKQMEQIVALLGRADAALSPRERQKIYFTKKNSLGSQPIEALQSFYCPITGDVLVDPVETSSGQTFERSAIEKWLADGKTNCPLTMNPLSREMLRPNITLRKSIEEWKDRNMMIMIAQMKTQLNSGNEQEEIQCLTHLRQICEEKEVHREWVALEDYIPTIVDLVGRRNPEIRLHALTILCILANDHDANKKRIAEADRATELIVRALGRRSTAENTPAVTLLVELSKIDDIRNQIGKVQGCILLLVGLSGGDNPQVAKDATDLLENLSSVDEFVILMAKSNYFKPLLHRISSGAAVSKKLMATTIAEMELTEGNKSILFDSGIYEPLLQLVKEDDTECKKVAVKALSNLSTLPQNCRKMIKDGAIGIFLPLLYHTATLTFRDHISHLIMNLAIAASSPENGDMFIPLLESDDDIFKLVTFISVNTPRVQRNLLQTVISLCRHSCARNIRTKLRQPQFSVVPMLILLCEHSELDVGVRGHAVKLFYCLTGDDEVGLLVEHISQKFLETLVQIMRTSEDKDEQTAAIGIIANLPRNDDQITQQLITAEALEVITGFLRSDRKNGFSSEELVGNAAKGLRRFTVSKNVDYQKKAAELGIIPLMVQILGSGSALARKHAAISLAQFSYNSMTLSRRVEKRGKFLCCSTPVEDTCPVHLGVCSTEESFCLVKADAVGSLVQLLGFKDASVMDASLRALSTLIEGDMLQNGCKVISEVHGIAAIIKLLSFPSPALQEKALRILDRVFSLQEYKKRYGRSAEMALVEIIQRGSDTLTPLASRILVHLNILQYNSSFL